MVPQTIREHFTAIKELETLFDPSHGDRGAINVHLVTAHSLSGGRVGPSEDPTRDCWVQYGAPINIDP